MNEKKEKKVDFNGGIRQVKIDKKPRRTKTRFKKEYSRRKNPLTNFFKKLGLVALIFIPIIFIIGYYFHSANITVISTDKEKPISFNHEVFKADIEGKDGLKFQWYEFDMEFKKEIKTDFVEDVKKQAIGKIKIINNFAVPKKLREETRFETEDGKLFKIYKSVTIPAKSSIVREAFADKPGEDFNLKKGIKLTIPGFKEVKNMKAYKNITGEIAEDFKGGFIGKKNIPNKDELEKKKKELQEEIKNAVAVKVRENLPKNLILNPDAIFTKINYEIIDDNGKSVLVAKAHTKAIVFNELDLISITTGLTKDKIQNYTIQQRSSLKFKILNKDKLSLDNLKSFNFDLNGQLIFKEKFDQKKFIDRVKGRNIKVVNNILRAEYPNFTFDIDLYPFWSNSIPAEEEKITLKIEK